MYWAAKFYEEMRLGFGKVDSFAKRFFEQAKYHTGNNMTDF